MCRVFVVFADLALTTESEHDDLNEPCDDFDVVEPQADKCESYFLFLLVPLSHLALPNV